MYTYVVITPYLVGKDKADLGPKVFFLWGALCCGSLLFGKFQSHFEHDLSIPMVVDLILTHIGTAYFLVPELRGLSLEQADMCMAEASPRKSAAWRPNHTFAADMGHVGEKHAHSTSVEETV